MFLLCEWTQQIWRDPKININFNAQEVTRFDKWLFETLTAREALQDRSLLAVVLWQIWKARNAWVFRACIPTPRIIVEEALTTNRSEASTAGLVRDHNGVLIDGLSELIRAESPLAAETLALKFGLQKILDLSLKPQQAKSLPEMSLSDKSGHSSDLQWELISDNLSLVNLLSAQDQSSSAPWPIFGLIVDCRTLLAQLKNTSIVYSPREGNACADWLAKSARLGLLPPNWLSNPPSTLRDFLCLDVLSGCFANVIS
ncbi:uncharacterized protein J3R85_019142 [Psidium guajava]|nr:uncharacterized protein J3R85_019142 [Psidium guajava]